MEKEFYSVNNYKLILGEISIFVLNTYDINLQTISVKCKYFINLFTIYVNFLIKRDGGARPLAAYANISLIHTSSVMIGKCKLIQ